MDDKKVLVTYASRAGSTAEVADMLANELSSAGLKVEVSSIDSVNNLQGYYAVVIGSPILKGAPLPEVSEFLKKHEMDLRSKKLAYFLTCLALSKFTDKELEVDEIYLDPSLPLLKASSQEMKFMDKDHEMSKYLKPLLASAPQLKPINTAFFAGKLDYKKLDFRSRMTMRLMSIFIKEIKEGDFINPDAIKGWSKELVSKR
ncbi:MAG: flavodoxin domain-containing protein [Bacillota bacterium]|nr:flavodoxin domain-containing protein [Bacillota bacterium]